MIRTAFAQETAQEAHEQWGAVADQLRDRFDKVAELMDEADHEVLAYMQFPRELRSKLHSTNTLERLNKELKLRSNVVGIFPNGHGARAPQARRLPSSAWSAPCSSSSTRNGPSPGATCPWKPSRLSATMPTTRRRPPWRPSEHRQPRRHPSYPLFHHASGHDRTLGHRQDASTDTEGYSVPTPLPVPSWSNSQPAMILPPGIRPKRDASATN